MSDSDQPIVVVEAINDLINAGTTFDTDRLERIYHNDLEVVTVTPAGDVSTANKADFINLFDTKRRNGDPALNNWSNFVHTAVDEDRAHVIVQRVVALGEEDQALTLSIDLVLLDGRWQVTREVIFAQPAP